MLCTEPTRTRRLNLHDHACLCSSRPITEAGVTPQYDDECLQGLLLSKNQAARRVEVDKTISNRWLVSFQA